MAEKEVELEFENRLFYNKPFIEQWKEDNNEITLMLHKLKKNYTKKRADRLL